MLSIHLFLLTTVTLLVDVRSQPLAQAAANEHSSVARLDINSANDVKEHLRRRVEASDESDDDDSYEEDDDSDNHGDDDETDTSSSDEDDSDELKQ